jgi:hypothetical protein
MPLEIVIPAIFVTRHSLHNETKLAELYSNVVT